MNLAQTNDSDFIKRLTEIVEANLGDEKFGVEGLVHLTGLGYRALRKRLKNLTGQTISQFISEIRLQKAMEMLQQSALTSSEVTYLTGFGSPAYFTQRFHKRFGYPPGEVKRKHQFQPESLPLPAVSPATAKKQSKLRIVVWIGAVLLLVPLAWYLYLHIFNGSRLLVKTKEYNRSIVILPFKNYSANTDNQYLADGIMEDILINLNRVSTLRVLSRTTSEHFRSKELTTRKIAGEVNARYMLEGSIRYFGNHSRISVQLIDARHDAHLWSANFDRDTSDILKIQGSVASQVADKLNASIPDREAGKLKKKPTGNSEAYDYYLRGRFLLNKANDEQRVDINREGLVSSIHYFDQAVAADSGFVEAWSGLANAWFNIVAWGWYQPSQEAVRKAKEATRKALEINPDCAEAHAIKAAILIWPERRFEEGRKELLTALQLNPDDSYSHQLMAQLLMITGPIDEARIHMDKVMQTEPYYWVVNNLNAYIYYFEGKHREAIEACQAARYLKPDYVFNDWLFFLNYAKLGKKEEAAKELQNILGKNAAAKQYAGEITEAIHQSGIPGLFKWVIDLNLKRPAPLPGLSGQPFFIAWWYAILGDREQSLYQLEKSIKSPGRMYTYLYVMATNPDFDFLRTDPRFLKIIDEIGLTPYNKRKAK